ncbi:MAG: hypothetical protein LBE76_05355 [Nitrososphaerota archaeon]|jgi:hypothetical protein|nr:hypothetical protein [Nitrososphaerota archaeon]
MKTLKNKNITLGFTVLMIISFVVSMIALPNANAQDIKTYPFADAAPKEIGLGQYVSINVGLTKPITGGGWNMTIYIIDPDDKVETFKRMTYETGSVGFRYTPTKEGNYTVYSSFEREQYNGRWHASSTSENATFQVLGGDYQRPGYPGHALPAEYWTRPIDGQLREWYSIAGSWPYKPKNLYAPYNDAPDTAHILWSMPVGDTMQGLAGGEAGVYQFQDGDAYEGKFVGSITICGILYYNRYISGSPQQTIVAVDLHTGKTLWERSYSFGGGRINTGQILSLDFSASHGVWTYIWLSGSVSGQGTVMYALDAYTGDLKYNMTNVPSGTIYRGANGEMLKYRMVNYGTTSSPNWYLQQWNSTHVVTRDRTGGNDVWTNNAQNVQYNADTRGWDLNVSVSGINFVPAQANVGASAQVGSLAGASQQAAPIVAYADDRVIFGNVSTAGITLSGFGLERESPGYTLFNRKTWNSPDEWKNDALASQDGWAGFSQEDLVAVYWKRDSRSNFGFSLSNGNFLYETQQQIYADAWGGVSSSRDVPEKIIVYNKLIEASVGGVVYCYDAKNGSLLWNYTAVDSTIEYNVLTGNWWLIPVAAADGKVYFGHHQHSEGSPKNRGAPFFALDVETGEPVWQINGAFRQTRWGGPGVIGDGIIATMDTYDNQIYAIGRGPSETTVSVSNAVPAAGSTVLISGTVMDISPGTEQYNVVYRHSKGVPAVSDADMSEWMLHVYKQFAEPLDVIGVEVLLAGEDVNGDWFEIGTTTSDRNGRFSFAWTPEKTGEYKIHAVFEGSGAYYYSTAQTEIAVTSSVAEVDESTPQYVWYIIAAVIVGIVVVIINMIIALKKK